MTNLDLPSDVARCPGATTRMLGESTLVRDCVNCLRRTASRDGDAIRWIAPEKVWPCYNHIPNDEWTVY
jgi:hypothetical protein